MAEKTAGQIAFEEDLRKYPNYPRSMGGGARPNWEQSHPVVRWSWERNPTARNLDRYYANEN